MLKASNHLVLDEIKIAKVPLKNRTAVAPMSRVSASIDGVPTALMADYYKQYAKGGFGLIITEGTYTDTKYAQGYPCQPGLTNSEQVAGWEKIAEVVHEYGGKIMMQLMHAGALSQALTLTIGPSAIQPLRHKMGEYGGGEGAYPLPREMTTADIQETINGFVATALQAQSAGFDGIEIHGANGYLLDQFLTEYTNTRTDKYGGAIENRVRLISEVIQAVKVAVDSNFIVGIRLSQGKVNDFDYRWPRGYFDAAVVFPAVAKSGADYIHFASEGRGYHHGSYTDKNESLPKLARQMTGLPVIANGGMHDIVQASSVLETGEADMIALGTGALVNPNWPNKIMQNGKIEPFNSDFFSSGVTLNKTGFVKVP